MLVLALVFATTGCLWRSYGTIMAVHLDVLTQMAAKLCAVVEAGRGPAAEDMAEYFYPAKRGRQFLRQFSCDRGRESYREFTVFLDRYEALVREVDAARAEGRNLQAALPRLTAKREALRQLAGQIRADLQAGH
ncbi:MAG: hypothetical protein ACE5I7_16755 [Candidatus Binatia bacterium]